MTLLLRDRPMILDRIVSLAKRLGVDTEIPMTALAQTGFRYSHAAFILGRVEQKLDLEPRGTLGERFQRANGVVR